MPILNIDLMTPDGILFEENGIPDDMQSAELVSRLVNTLGLPRTTESGAPINYSLEIVNQGVRLQSGQTLGDAGATNGDVIRLLSSHKFQKPSESEPPPRPVVNNNPSPAGARTASTRNGALLIIPINGPNASVSKILGRLKDSLGVRPEEVSVLNPSKLNRNAPVSTALQPSRQVFGKYRTAMLAGMAVMSCFFLMFAISSKKKTESIAQANELPSAPAYIPSPAPLPAEPSPEPTPEPTPESKQESLSLQSSTPIRQTIVKVVKVVRTVQPKPTPVIMAQNTSIKLPELSKPGSLIAAQNVSSKMPENLNTKPMIVAQAESAEIPPPPQKCGTWRKMFVGCKNKQAKKSKTGGAAGVAQSAAESKAKSTIRRGVGKTFP